ncbi:MAG: hypothetical protein EBS01_00140 [Verrucomicrobia bacterium]|nr:hypothetical protein [Verrucomicrobiota bacterium]
MTLSVHRLGKTCNPQTPWAIFARHAVAVTLACSEPGLQEYRQTGFPAGMKPIPNGLQHEASFPKRPD